MTATRILLMLAIGGVLALTLPTRARQDSEVFQSRTLTIEGKTFQYRIFVPKDWSRKKKWPVILFLHGAGERGDDNLAQTRVGLGPAILRQQDRFNSIVVMPQCPTNRWWSESDMQAMALKSLDQTAKEFNGDATQNISHRAFDGRIRFVDYGGNEPEKVCCYRSGVRRRAASSPAESAASDDRVRRRSRSVWRRCRSCRQDSGVGFSRGRRPRGSGDRISKDGRSAESGARRCSLQRVPRRGHNSWDKAYAEPELFPWLMSQHKK